MSKNLSFTVMESRTIHAALEIITKKLQEEEQGTSGIPTSRAARKGLIQKSVANNRARRFYKQR